MCGNCYRKGDWKTSGLYQNLSDQIRKRMCKQISLLPLCSSHSAVHPSSFRENYKNIEIWKQTLKKNWMNDTYVTGKMREGERWTCLAPTSFKWFWHLFKEEKEREKEKEKEREKEAEKEGKIKGEKVKPILKLIQSLNFWPERHRAVGEIVFIWCRFHFHENENLVCHFYKSISLSFGLVVKIKQGFSRRILVHALSFTW